MLKYLSLMTFWLLSEANSHALTPGARVDFFSNPLKGFQKKSLHQIDNSSRPIFGLTAGKNTLSDDLNAMIQNHTLNPYITFKPTADKNTYRLRNAGKNIRGHLMAGNVEVCRSEIGAHESWDGKRAFVGSVAYISPHSRPTPIDQWPALEDSLYPLKEFVINQLGSGPLQITSFHKCHFIEDGKLQPSYLVNFQYNDSPYYAYIDDLKVYSMHTIGLHSTAIAEVYPLNINNGPEVEKEIEVDGSGFLQNSVFRTVTNAVERVQSTNETRAGKSVKKFSAPAGNKFKKGEINTFTNAWQHYKYFNSLGYSNPDGLIDINLNVTINNSQNNALYTPAVGPSQPRISVSNGDGVLLQNLALDADVVSHELGHHVVWRTLKNPIGETLILHEGLADFFTFSAHGDDCLGESICPADSTFCWIQSQCLRTADNDLRYKGSIYEMLSPHHRGQLVSGMLWDLHENEGLPLFEVAQLTHDAVDLLSSSSQITDLIIALNIADRNLTNGQNLCAIKKVAEDRGFGPYVNMDDCSAGSSWSSNSQTGSTVGIGGSSPNIEQSNREEKENDDILGFCAIGKTKSKGSIVLLLLLLIPFTLSQFPRVISSDK